MNADTPMDCVIELICVTALTWETLNAILPPQTGSPGSSTAQARPALSHTPPEGTVMLDGGMHGNMPNLATTVD